MNFENLTKEEKKQYIKNIIKNKYKRTPPQKNKYTNKYIIVLKNHIYLNDEEFLKKFVE